MNRSSLLLIGLFALFMWVGVLPAAARGPGQEAAPAVHVVRFGETLSEIAQAYGVSTRELMARNGIEDADTIVVGQKLAIPSSVAEQPDPPAAAPDEGEASASERSVSISSLNRTYRVESGDTLAWVALRFGVEYEALRTLNGIQPGGGIRVGQQLILPATQNELQVTTPMQTYTVRAGESLSGIAAAHGIALQTLMSRNGISNPDAIRIGRELIIPGQVREEVAPSVGPERSGFLYHDVSPGDTMSVLSQIFDTTPQAIVRYNGLPDESTLFSGLEIRIPYGPPQVSRRLPPTPRSGTEFVISITRQRCWVMRNDRVVHEWQCSTGQGEWVTRTGTFPIKTRMEMAQSSAYRLDMPYWLGLYDVGAFENGIHGLPVDWTTGEKLWDELVGQPATFGCAMLLDEEAARLYELSYIGMPVHIVD